MRFPAKITSSCIWVVIPDDWVILNWYACGADGRPYGHMITKNFSDGYHIFLDMGLRFARKRTREASLICWRLHSKKKKTFSMMIQ